MAWLRNLQGQLSDLANEVLNEATEEVADPESELQACVFHQILFFSFTVKSIFIVLQVTKKKYAEAEQQLLQEHAKVSSLESRLKELEQQLFDTHVEMDAIGTKYGTMVQNRDDEIKRIKVQFFYSNDFTNIIYDPSPQL